MAVNRLGAWVDLLENPSTPAGEDAIMEDDDEFEEPAIASASRTLDAAVAGKTAADQSKRYLSKRQQQAHRLAMASTTVPDLTPPDPAHYIALKASLKRVLPVDIFRQAENETKETMNGVEEYATRRGIVPDNGWGGLRRMQQQKSMLDFVKDADAPTTGESGSPA